MCIHLRVLRESLTIHLRSFTPPNLFVDAIQWLASAGGDSHVALWSLYPPNKVQHQSAAA